MADAATAAADRRRTAVTATAAGAVLCALWFVPTAEVARHDPPARPAHAAGARHPGHAGVDRVPGATRADRAARTEQPRHDRAAHAAGATLSAPRATAATLAGPHTPGPHLAGIGLPDTAPYLAGGLGLAGAGGVAAVRSLRRTVASRTAGGRGGAGR